ncbi:MAG: CDP-alcohol phosphatidyltransferase family protein [Kofleriaceae bacterium]
MNLFAVRKQLDRVLHPVVSTIARPPIHANVWTLIGAMLGAAGSVLFYLGLLWPAFALLIVRGLVDHIDGYKARNFGQRSTFGAVMDDVADRWVLGVMFAGGCLWLSPAYPHVLVVMALGITGALVNVIIKLSIYAEAHQDIRREHGKIGHPVDVVGMFGSAEFIIYFGAGVFFTALLRDPRPMLVGCWAVAVMAHVSLLQRMHFAWRHYRRVDPAAAAMTTERPGEGPRGDGPPPAGPRSIPTRCGSSSPAPRPSARWPDPRPDVRHGHRARALEPPVDAPPRKVSNLNPANAITASRFLTLPPFVWAVDQGYAQIATLALLICAALDMVDGLVARLLRCQTPFGEVFDAIADGFCYGFFMVVLTAYGQLPWLPVVITIAFGVYNTYLRAAYARRAGRTVNFRSWAMEKLVAYGGYNVLFGVAQIEVDFYLWGFVAIMGLTLVHDTKRMLIDPIDPPEVPA